MQTHADDEQPGDEITAQPGDTLASAAEIRQAIDNLYRNTSAKKRLVAVATMILASKSQLKREYQPDDLFQEAIERVCMGKRKWPKNRVDFPGLIIGVMKSWASSLEKTKSREDDPVIMEHELAPASVGDDGPNLEEIATDHLTPVEHLEAMELEAEKRTHLVILRAQYEAQELPARILDAIIEGSFETQEEVRIALGIKEADFWNAWKALMRATKKLESKE